MVGTQCYDHSSPELNTLITIGILGVVTVVVVKYDNDRFLVIELDKKIGHMSHIFEVVDVAYNKFVNERRCECDDDPVLSHENLDACSIRIDISVSHWVRVVFNVVVRHIPRDHSVPFVLNRQVK